MFTRTDFDAIDGFPYPKVGGPVIDWDSPQWGMEGQNTHKGTWVPDGHSDNGTAGEDD